MGVRFPSVQSSTFVGPFPANANETVILTTPPLNIPLDNAPILILWAFSVVAGTNCLGFTLRLRRGTTTGGAIINANPWLTISSSGANFQTAGWYFDTPGAVAGQQYSLTAVQVAATAASLWQDGAMLAYVL